MRTTLLRLRHRTLVATRQLCTAPHEVLGVSHDASRTTVKAAFRKLALQHHPDMPTGCAAKYAKLHEAMEAMTDRAARGGTTGATGGPSWAGSHHSHSEAEEEEGEWREYQEVRRRAAEQAREEGEDHEETRARMLRGLKLVVGYVVIGAAIKLALMRAAWEAREAGFASASVEAAAARGGIQPVRRDSKH